MAGLSAPRAFANKTVATSSSILAISSTLINFATTDISSADQALITANSSNYSVVAYGTTAPSATNGILLATGMQPFVVKGNANVKNIYVTSATTLASAISITLEKY